MILFILVFIGAFIDLLFGLNKATAKEDFSFKTFIVLNGPAFILNILCGCVLVYVMPDLEGLGIFGEFAALHEIIAVFLGFSGQGIFKKIMSIFSKRVKTKIGVNEK